MKRKSSLLMILTLLAAVSLVFGGAPRIRAAGQETEATDRNSREMTELWFADAWERTKVPDGAPAGTENAVMSYFRGRGELMASGKLPESICGTAAASEQVTAQQSLWLDSVDAFQQSVGLQIRDAETTVLYDQDHVAEHADGSWSLYAYEWTFFDYDMTGDNRDTQDVSGFGLYHKLTFREVSGKVMLVSDEYDAGIPFGFCSMNESTQKELLEMDFEEPDQVVPTEPAEPGAVSYYKDYSPDACVEYSDRYVWHEAQGGTVYEDYYNSAYRNYNSVGGDCANYVSQCIYAGGMPMVEGTAYGADGWFYYSSGNRSATWTGAYYLQTWMAGHRGKLLDAKDTNIYKGSPIIYDERHAVICVGRNTAGVPIMNAHNNDWYHGVWNYWQEEVPIKTVQLTTADPIPAGDTLTTGALTLPEEIRQGSDFTIGGKVISGITNLKDFALYVYDARGKAFMGVSMNPGTKEVRLSELNQYLPFRSLPEGTYTIRISASNANIAGEVVSAELRVVPGSQPVGYEVVACPRSLQMPKTAVSYYWAPGDAKAAMTISEACSVTASAFAVLSNGTKMYCVPVQVDGVNSIMWAAGSSKIQDTAIHDYGELVVSETHPHLGCYVCACGDTIWTEDTHWYEQCPICNSTGIRLSVSSVELTASNSAKATVRVYAEGYLPEHYDICCEGTNADYVSWKWGNADGTQRELVLTGLHGGRDGTLTVSLVDTDTDQVAASAVLRVDVEERGSYSCSSAGFTDVPGMTNWAHEAIDYVLDEGLMNGMSATTFGPNVTLNRAMLVTVLWRLEGSPKGCTQNFSDVPEGQWYSDAVAWAAENRIVSGVSKTRFDPTGSATREQTAVILNRYTVYRGMSAEAKGDLSGFADQASVSSWAYEAVKWAVGADLVRGIPDGSDVLIDPQGKITRAQLATILMRYLKA